MIQNFENAVIYKITNDFNSDIYIGSTCNTLTKRFSGHKTDANQEKNKSKPLYKLINEIGFDRFRIQLIEKYPCEDRYQLRQREGKYIRELGTLNINIAGRLTCDYHVEKKEEIKQNEKIYRDANKGKISERKKKYYDSNKEELKERRKIFIEKNKEHYDSKQKQYNEARKEKSFTCECGCIVKRLSQHIKSEIHKSNMDKLK
jgi:group I intron endonuclease